MAKKKTTRTAQTRVDEIRDEIQSDLPRSTIEDIESDLSCAEECETLEDLRANLDAMIGNATELANQCRELLAMLDNLEAEGG